MAKQSGLHQLRGKVGEYSYYRQTGIESGLMRSINQGLSERVKTSEEFANTRLNNTEFGAAGNVAGLLGQMVTPKFRPMVLPFSQAKMAREILKVARQHDENWGQRVVTSADTQKLCDILSSMSKRNPREFVTTVITRSDAATANVAASYSVEQSTLMSSLGINYLYVTAYQYDLATGQWVPAALMMSTGYFYTKHRTSIIDGEIIAGESETIDEDITIDQFVPEANHSAHQLVVFVVLPARKIGGVVNILQEYCSFWATRVPDAQ